VIKRLIAHIKFYLLRWILKDTMTDANHLFWGDYIRLNLFIKFKGYNRPVHIIDWDVGRIRS